MDVQLQLDRDFADRPLHERIAATIRKAVSDNDLAAGARLPSASDLADWFEVNVNTVLRAYRQLASEKLIDLRPGRGATVTGEPALTRLLDLADELLDEAARLGITRGELARILAQRS
ncbi:MAG: winged helix-turn-helix domain-containing protein [Acidimicrobiia bacterium]